MSKKSIVLNYKTPLEFIAFYAKKGYEREKEDLEKLTSKTLLELIAMVQDSTDEYWFKLQRKIVEFANECGFNYCYEHNIFHEYDICPFCSLDIKLD